MIVNVGAPPTEFTVHQELIVASSKYAKTAFSTTWARKTAQGQQLIELPNVEASTFEAYHRWLYYRTFTDSLWLTLSSTEWLTRFAMMFILGDYLQDTSFCNAVINAIIEAAGLMYYRLNRYPFGSIGLVYKETLRGSPLRRLLVDFHVEDNCENLQYESMTDEAKDDVIAAYQAAWRCRGGTEPYKPWIADRCQYHIHEVVDLKVGDQAQDSHGPVAKRPRYSSVDSGSSWSSDE